MGDVARFTSLPLQVNSDCNGGRCYIMKLREIFVDKKSIDLSFSTSFVISSMFFILKEVFTARLSRLRGSAQDAKDAPGKSAPLVTSSISRGKRRFMFFYRIGTDDSIKQSALRAF